MEAKEDEKLEVGIESSSMPHGKSPITLYHAKHVGEGVSPDHTWVSPSFIECGHVLERQWMEEEF